MEVGGPSRAGFFLACMEMNGKEDIDESDERRGWNANSLVPELRSRTNLRSSKHGHFHLFIKP